MQKTRYQVSDAELAFLGFRLSPMNESSMTAIVSTEPFDIERIFFKICLALEYEEFNGRLASLLVTWNKVHGDKLHVDRLRKLRENFAKDTGKDSHWLRYLGYVNMRMFKRHNWKHITQSVLPPGEDPTYFLAGEEHPAKAMMKVWGKDKSLPSHSPLKVHEGAFRIRDEDVLSKTELIDRNQQYATRFYIGSNARADIVYHYEMGHFRTAAEISKFLGLSRETARKNIEDYEYYKSAKGRINA